FGIGRPCRRRHERGGANLQQSPARDHGETFLTQPVRRCNRSLSQIQTSCPTLSGEPGVLLAGAPPSRALRLAANSPTRRRPSSWARLERETCASAPCRLYSTVSETRVCRPSSSGARR